ncbi:hypothetical protein ElyMa_002060600 [Elysia marginata]|uniref:BHLH domain-containing protein n=1 Tax=Elysia marginata TaxID=1093978 RepID=A0AAV4F9Q1_9GAST|nr:hypothetical protein ElyMa_002060600 [Elysia marginata]
MQGEKCTFYNISSWVLTCRTTRVHTSRKQSKAVGNRHFTTLIFYTIFVPKSPGKKKAGPASEYLEAKHRRRTKEMRNHLARVTEDCPKQSAIVDGYWWPMLCNELRAYVYYYTLA